MLYIFRERKGAHIFILNHAYTHTKVYPHTKRTMLRLLRKRILHLQKCPAATAAAVQAKFSRLPKSRSPIDFEQIVRSRSVKTQRRETNSRNPAASSAEGRRHLLARDAAEKAIMVPQNSGCLRALPWRGDSIAQSPQSGTQRHRETRGSWKLSLLANVFLTEEALLFPMPLLAPVLDHCEASLLTGPSSWVGKKHARNLVEGR